MTFNLYKLQGTGNDFLLFDARTPSSREALLKHAGCSSNVEFVKKICDRHFGVGADGFIFIEPSLKYSLKWDFYNSDGSSAEMCGNAARCVAVWASQVAQFNNKNTLEAQCGTIELELLKEQYASILMTPITDAKLNQKLKLADHNLIYDFINSGVPHVVIVSDDLQITIDKNLCSLIRNHSVFQPKGTNVTLYKELGLGKIQAISFERGVEDFTLSCGTGAVAAAYSYFSKNPSLQKVDVLVPGGELQVEFNDKKVYLKGPAILVAKIEIFHRSL